MGINGPQATACYGGLGTYVCRGENRVLDLECHANCLRERLDRLEAMLPSVLIEASIAIQKGERPPDLLQLTQAEDAVGEERKEEIGTKGESKKGGELPCVELGCGQGLTAGNIIEDEDEPRVCMLQVLARKEKRLRKKIYEMELKEERYKKALADAGDTLVEAETSGVKNSSLVCPPQCPGTKNETVMGYRTATSSQDPYDDPVEQRIHVLEASSKKISKNLKNLHKERAELTCRARNLTEELRCTQKCLGEVQQRVLGNSPSQVIPVMGEPSLDDIYEKPKPCCAKTGKCATRLPQNPEALRNLAGQFKDAYKNAENEGFSPSIREPIRKTAERLRALSNLDPNACPCGQPIKCDSCIICSCAEWERDLEGGGDEPLEESSSENETTQRVKKTRKELTDLCHCGCNETSSESECPCGCSNLQVQTAEVCPCSCDQVIESSAMSTSDPSTITETTIPSSDTDDSGYRQVGRGDAYGHQCDLPSCGSSCSICRNENPQKSGTITMENICKDQCEPLNDLPNESHLCKICSCDCTMCNIIENQKKSSPRELRRPIINDLIVSHDSNVNPVECTCLDSSEVPPGIQKVCKVGKLREGLENLKNRNHAMRKILKSCGCLSPIEDSSLSPPSPGDQMDCNCPGAKNTIKQTPSGLMSTVRLLQSKCRTKDGMIVALANELKKAATPEQTSRILECLADPSLCCGVNDFDRSELWNYLKNSSGKNHRDLGDSEEMDEAQLYNKTDCDCRIDLRHPDPPRKLTVRARVSGDGLIISWLPPLTGAVAGYEVLAEGEIVGRIRTPMRTETFVGGLDLRGMVLLEVRTISTNGLRSGTIEKLFYPTRSNV